MAHHAHRGERGFTLIETLVAGVVLMIGVMATLALISRANATTSVTGNVFTITKANTGIVTRSCTTGGSYGCPTNGSW